MTEFSGFGCVALMLLVSPLVVLLRHAEPMAAQTGLLSMALLMLAWSGRLANLGPQEQVVQWIACSGSGFLALLATMAYCINDGHDPG